MADSLSWPLKQHNFIAGMLWLLLIFAYLNVLVFVEMKLSSLLKEYKLEYIEGNSIDVSPLFALCFAIN